MSKRNLTEEEKKIILDGTITTKCRFRMYREMMENPKPLPLKLDNRRVAFPMIMIDEFKENPQGGKPIKLLDAELNRLKDEAARKPYPVMAYDPKLVEEGHIKEGETNYAMYLPWEDEIVHHFHYNGLAYIVVDFFSIIAFVDKNDLPLLSSKLPSEELEKQKKIEEEQNESKI